MRLSANELLTQTTSDIDTMPDNPAVTIISTADGSDLSVKSLDKVEEPVSLVALRAAVDARLPQLDLPELILEVHARTGFADHFTHARESRRCPQNFAEVGHVTLPSPPAWIRTRSLFAIQVLNRMLDAQTPSASPEHQRGKYPFLFS